MIDELLSERTADAILSGRADRGTIAPELHRIVELLDVVRSPAVPQELDGEDAIVDAVLEAMGATQKRVDVDAQRRRRAKRRTARAVAAIALVALTGTAAAATNHLPTPSRRWFQMPVRTSVFTCRSRSTSRSRTQSGHEARCAIRRHRCELRPRSGSGRHRSRQGRPGTAHFAHGTSPSDHAGGVAEQNLQAAAAAAGQSVDEFCADVVHQPSSSSESEAPADSTDSSTSSANSQKPADPANPADTPSASSHPNSGKNPDAPPAHGLNRSP